MKKKLAMGLALVMTLTMLAGCSSNEQTVYDAMIKGNEILSCEMDMNLSAKVKVSGMPEAEAAKLKGLLDTVNSSSVSMKMKETINKEMTETRALVSMGIKGGGVDYDMDVYLDAGTKENGKQYFKEIMAMPDASTALNTSMAGKKYVVMDFDYLTATSGTDMTGFMKKMPEFAALYTDTMTKFAKDYNFDKEILTAKGTKELNGEKVKVYEMKMDDALFKEWLKYTLTLAADKDYVQNFLDSYMTYLLEIAQPANGSAADAKAVKDQIKMISDATSFAAADVEKLFATLKDIPLVGADGVVVEFNINNAGHITGMDGTLNLTFDLNKWSTILGVATMEGMNPIIDVAVNFDYAIKNINKPIKITLPEITPANSVDFADMMVDMSQSAKVYLQGERIYYPVAPVIENGSTLVPLRETAEAMDMKVTWDGATSTVTAEKGTIKIVVKINDLNATVNGEAKTLNVPARIIGSKTMVPTRFISENMNMDVDWDQDNRAVLITEKKVEKTEKAEDAKLIEPTNK